MIISGEHFKRKVIRLDNARNTLNQKHATSISWKNYPLIQKMIPLCSESKTLYKKDDASLWCNNYASIRIANTAKSLKGILFDKGKVTSFFLRLLVRLHLLWNTLIFLINTAYLFFLSLSKNTSTSSLVFFYPSWVHTYGLLGCYPASQGKVRLNHLLCTLYHFCLTVSVFPSVLTLFHLTFTCSIPKMRKMAKTMKVDFM